jgi:predicted small lipoprotein YifL
MLSKTNVTRAAKASFAVTMLGVILTLTGCASFGDMAFPTKEKVVEPVITTQSGTELEGSLIHSGYVLLPDGREVLCVSNSLVNDINHTSLPDQGGGITCDWDNARVPSPEN